MNTLFIAWQAPFDRRWFPIGRLTSADGRYRYHYTKGANQAQEFGFAPLPAFPELEAVYESETLFPLFSNRLLQESRPDYQNYTDWMSIPDQKMNPISLLALSEGQRASGDSLMVFPKPEKNAQGLYRIYFFVHGIRYFDACVQDRIVRLREREKLLLAIDCQNSHDPKAILIRTADQAGSAQIGWLPRYLTNDIHSVLYTDPGRIRTSVERVNPPPAPAQLRVLCVLEADWLPEGEPFQSPEFAPLA